MASTSPQTDTTSQGLLYILAIILPPASVYLKTGCDGHFFVNIVLLILAWFPAIIHALYVVYTRRGTSYSPSSRRRNGNLEKGNAVPYQDNSFPQATAPVTAPDPIHTQGQSGAEIQPAGAAPPYPYSEAPKDGMAGEVRGDEKHEYRPVQ